MALRRTESFDSFTTLAQFATKPGWTVFGTPTLEANGRRSTRNLMCAGSNGCGATLSLPTADVSGVVGFAWQANNLNSGFPVFSIVDGATFHLSFEWDGANHLQCRRGLSGTVLATGTTAFITSTYYYIEIKHTIDNTTGYVEVRLNGSAVAELSFSGDTQNGGSAQWTGLAFHGQQFTVGSPSPKIDDVYLCDSVDSTATHGLPNNDFLGDCRCDFNPSSSGNGTNTDFTTSTGADHGALVDETTPNDDTDYNDGTALGNKDTYNLPSLSFTPSVIFGVQGFNYVKKTDAGARAICDVVRSGGADYDGAAQNLSTSYAYYTEMWESDPATAAPWDEAGVNALEHGLKVTT